MFESDKNCVTFVSFHIIMKTPVTILNTFQKNFKI